MNIKLHNSHVLIGAKSSTEQALNLPLVPPEETLITVNDVQYVSYFCSLPSNNQNDSSIHESLPYEELTNKDKASRCIYLVKQLVLQIELSGETLAVDAPIFWLLPEFVEPFANSIDANIEQDNNSNTLTYFAKKLQQAFPQLFGHAQSQLFPFGRASFSIALTAAKRLFEEGNADNITLISVDSLWHDISQLFADDALVSENSEQGIIPSEGVIFTQISPADKGVSIDFIQNSVAPSKQRDLTVKQLFTEGIAALAALDSKALSSQQDQDSEQKNEQQTATTTLSHLYLPGNGDETLQNAWLDAYYQLAGTVDSQTKICQSAFFTGELGCVTGLYNFLHIVNGYENEFIQGNVLQLEVSNSLHQGVVLYSYDNQTYRVKYD